MSSIGRIRLVTKDGMVSYDARFRTCLRSPHRPDKTGRNLTSLMSGKGIKYWEDVPASVDGVLGGFGHVSA